MNNKKISFKILNFWEDLKGTKELMKFEIFNLEETGTFKSHNDFFVDVYETNRINITDIIHPINNRDSIYRLWVTHKYESIHLPRNIIRLGVTPIVTNMKVLKLDIKELKEFDEWVLDKGLLLDQLRYHG